MSLCFVLVRVSNADVQTFLFRLSLISKNDRENFVHGTNRKKLFELTDWNYFPTNYTTISMRHELFRKNYNP